MGGGSTRRTDISFDRGSPGSRPGTGGRPLHLEGDVTGMVSIDHAAWFHRPLRADEWLFYDVHSLVNTGGRGVLRGTMYGPDRHVAVSVAQEMLLRPVPT